MAQKFLSIKNFDKYQTFTKQNPPWFKIHKSMFGDREFMKLSTHHRFLYVGLIHLAVETNNKIYNDPTWIGQRLYLPPTAIDLKPLYRSGFLVTSNIWRSLSETESESESETESETEGEAHAPKARPTPLPPDFKFTPEFRDWALVKGCKEPFAEHERFVSKARAKGWTYLDWDQARQNWVLNELKWAREKQHA